MLNDEGRVLTTIEDPVEFRIPGVTHLEEPAPRTHTRGCLSRAASGVRVTGDRLA